MEFMKEKDLWQTWIETRERGSQIRRLVSEVVVRHEYKHASFPHPSSYAYLELSCGPLDGLAFARTCKWPEAAGDGPTQDALDRAIATGLIDALVNSTVGKNPFVRWSCVIRCIDIKWHAEASSEVAFYRAAFGAARELLIKGRWL